MYRKVKQTPIIDLLKGVMKSLDQLEKAFLERSIKQLEGVKNLAKVKENGKTGSNRS